MTTQQAFRNTLVVLLTLAAAYVFLISIRFMIVLVVAIIVASALRPLVLRLMAWRVPGAVAIILVYATTLLAILLLSVAVLGPIISRFGNYLENEWLLTNRVLIAQEWIENRLTEVTGSRVVLADPDNVEAATNDLLRRIRTTVPALISGFSGTIGEAVLVFIMGVYWLTSREKAVAFITSLFSAKNRERVSSAIVEIETTLGTYLRGMVLVGLFVGFANFAILSLLRIPNAGTLGFIIGIGTLLPVIGGFIGGGLATLIAALGSPLHGAVVFATFVAVQQIETNYLTPRTMSRSVGLEPLLIFVAVFAGFTLFGVVGAVIAVPVMGTIGILLRYLVIEPHVATVEYKTEKGAVLLDSEPVVEVEKPAPKPS